MTSGTDHLSDTDGTIRAANMQRNLCTHASGHRIVVLTNVPGRRQQTRVAAVSTTQQSHHVQQLSTVMLVNENLKRRLGRGLVQPEQLVQAVEVVQQAQYSLVVVEAQPQRDSFLQDDRCHVLFANPSAADLLCQQGRQQPQDIHLPAAVAAVSCRYSKMGQQQRQPEDQQKTSLRVFGAVPWLLAGDMHITVDRMLVCPVDAPNGTFVGLALLFDRWSYPSDGCIGAPGYPRTSPTELPTKQLLQGAADAVRQQADAVRQLKQGLGLSNKDPEVTAAVAELQQSKRQLERLEGLQATFQQERHGVFKELLDAYCEQQQQ